MKRLLAVAGVVLVLSVLTVACDTTQPTSSGPATYEVQFSAINVIGFTGGEGIKSYRVWEMYEDGAPELYNFCRSLVVTVNPVQTHNNPTTIPWSFTVQIGIIPAGFTEEEFITSAAALTEDTTINLTGYDTSERPLITGAIQSDITVDDMGTMRTFKFRNPVKLSSAHARVARSISNPLSDMDPALYGFENGLCSLTDPGPTVTDGQSPFTFELSSGDTVIVRALRGEFAPPGIDTNGREPQLSGALTRSGAGITVIGTQSGDAVYRSGFSYSFTAR